ncbi:MAG: Fe-S-containing protein [Oscillospiraceae bacterium]|jgi:hypothetical protein|nr:Fe-S-containing protein [Oscillospiraceae bacterium]
MRVLLSHWHCVVPVVLLAAGYFLAGTSKRRRRTTDGTTAENAVKRSPSKSPRGPWSVLPLVPLALLVTVAGCGRVDAPADAPATPGVSGTAPAEPPQTQAPETDGDGPAPSGADPADPSDPLAPSRPADTPAPPEEGDGVPDSSAPADEPAAPDAPSADPGTAGNGGDLVIPIAGITEQASFYPVEVNGTQLEVIAVKAPDGTLRTAFNTCQICYDSGQGYYKQEGNALVCQNCGSLFTMDRIEKAQGGCNPVPIYADYKTVDEENITISGAFLEEATVIFQNWKTSY